MPDTLLGFEATGPSISSSRVWETGGSGVVVALLWWWGVVFDLWIVVASIDPAVFWAVGFDNAIFDSSENF